MPRRVIASEARVREFSLRLGKALVDVAVEARTVVLCDDAPGASRMAKAFIEAGAVAVDTADWPRGTVREHLPKRLGAEQVQKICDALRLDPAVLEWRPREADALHRMVASTLIGLAREATALVFDLTPLAGSPFDIAHTCAHMRRVASEFDVTVIAIITDPALITSAGSHLVAVAGSEVVEAGSVVGVLARPVSEHLIRRLESTPIPSPMAMQMRRVQRVATHPVNYAHTTIIQLPTSDSIALAGGEE